MMDKPDSIGAAEKPRETDVAKPADAQDHPLSQEEKLEESLVDSMDGSDPPAATQPGDHGEPVPSSGFTEKDDRAARRR